MAHDTANPNKRALRAIRNIAVLFGLFWLSQYGFMLVGMYQCHQRGFEITWEEGGFRCFIDASNGLPKPRW